MYMDAFLVTGPFKLFSSPLYVRNHHVDVFVVVEVGFIAVGGVGAYVDLLSLVHCGYVVCIGNFVVTC